MIMHRDHEELGMRYEGLACAVFECNRWDDPWHIASVDPFNAHLINPDDKLRSMLHTVIDVAIWKHKNNEQLVTDLLAFKNRVYEIANQDNVHPVVTGLIILLEESAGY